MNIDVMFPTVKCIGSGIQKGSNLRPLLFLLYLNNLSMSSEVWNFVNFADDTTALLSHPSSDSLYTCFNKELSEVSEWLRVNRLSLSMLKKPAL